MPTGTSSVGQSFLHIQMITGNSKPCYWCHEKTCRILWTLSSPWILIQFLARFSHQCVCVARKVLLFRAKLDLHWLEQCKASVCYTGGTMLTRVCCCRLRTSCSFFSLLQLQTKKKSTKSMSFGSWRNAQQTSSGWCGSTISGLLARRRRWRRSGRLFPHDPREVKGRAHTEDAGTGSPLGVSSYPSTWIHSTKRDEFLFRC